MWDLAQCLLLLSNDIHPLPGPGRLHTFKVLSLNVGGPHLSKKRWNQLLQETTAAQPTLIAYQEVRFKSGYNHMCQVARMAPQYQPITHTASNPDVIFVAHRSIAQYTRLLQPAHPCGVAVEVSLPDRPPFSAANIHGPFDRRSRTSLDHWISQLPRLGLLMGDFNHGKESMWPRHRPLRWWHHKLLDGTLLDPASCVTADMNSPLLTTRKGVRLDAVLVSDTIWHALTPTGCSTRTYPSAGDHKAVAAVFGSAIQDGSDHREYTGSVQHWHTSTFNTFQKHMTKWSRQTSLSGSPQERYEAIFHEIHQFVQNHRPKAPQVDVKEEQFRTACKCAPTSQRALKDWGDYMGRKQAIASHKALRRFHKSAVKSARTFYQDMKVWMHTPFQMT